MTADTQNPDGWPDAARPGVPANPEQSGAHRLRHRGSDLECDALWSCGGTWLDLSGDFSATHAAAFYDYLGPCLTPAEVEARVAVARIEGVIVGADDLDARVAAARREGVEAAAKEIDCDCDNRDEVLARLEARDCTRASWLCRHGDVCCALQAAEIRTLKWEGRR